MVLRLFVCQEQYALTLAIFQAKSEGTFIYCSVLVDLATHALRQPIYEPAFVNVRLSAVFAALILEDSTEAVEVLGRD